MAGAQQFVEHKIAEKSVVLFSKSYCPESKKIKKLMRGDYSLDTQTFEAVDIERRQDMNQIEDYFMIKCLCDRRETPQLWIDGLYIGNEAEIMRLHELGKLTKLLKIREDVTPDNPMTGTPHNPIPTTPATELVN